MIEILFSHFDSFDLDSPWVGCVVEGRLHDVADGFSLRQDLSQVLGAQHIPESRGGQQSSGVAEMTYCNYNQVMLQHTSVVYWGRGKPVVLDVVGGHGGVGHAVVDHGVDADSYRVTGQNLLR